MTTNHFSTKKRNLFVWAVLIIIVLFGLIFRLIGIEKGLSFWNDEDHTALMSRGILWYGRPSTPYGTVNGLYQIAYYYLTATSFKIGGINETSGRAPSVIAGTLLVVAVYLLASRTLGRKVALIASFLTAFSQIQLAWSTQLRPYVWLELTTVVIAYLVYVFSIQKSFLNRYLFLSLSLIFMSILIHPTGIMSFLPLGMVFAHILLNGRKYLILGVLSLLLMLSSVVGYLFLGHFQGYVLSFSFETLHYRIFLTHNYLWLLIPAIGGSLLLLKRNLVLAIIFGATPFLLILIANFKINPNYIRYCLPAFPLLYISFAYGSLHLAKVITKNKLVSLLFATTFITWGIIANKILLFPRYYYSINADVRENPIMDYKILFLKIPQLVKDRDDVVVLDGWNDRVPYYLPGQKFYFLTDRHAGNLDKTYGEQVIKNVMEFQQIQKTHKAGVVIIENWESLTPDHLKSYVKNQLKHEFDVNNLPYNEDDKWSASVYTWGI